MKARKKHIRVLVADDQKLFREMLVCRLSEEADMEVVGEAESGTEALNKAIYLKPDILLLDIQLGDMDGLEVTERIKLQVPDVKVVLLTGFPNEEYIYRGFQVGASGYLSKDDSVDNVLDAVRQAHEGDALLDPTSTTRIIREFEQRGKVGPDIRERELGRRKTIREPIRLTPRETDVLRLIADGLSNQEIAERLVISEYTVKTHVSNLFRKLGINDRVQAVLYALDIGLHQYP